MSADNGLIIKEKNNKYILSEYDASSGAEYNEEEFRTLKEACIVADKRMSNRVIEYGLRFNFKK